MLRSCPWCSSVRLCLVYRVRVCLIRVYGVHACDVRACGVRVCGVRVCLIRACRVRIRVCRVRLVHICRVRVCRVRVCCVRVDRGVSYQIMTYIGRNVSYVVTSSSAQPVAYGIPLLVPCTGRALDPSPRAGPGLYIISRAGPGRAWAEKKLNTSGLGRV